PQPRSRVAAEPKETTPSGAHRRSTFKAELDDKKNFQRRKSRSGAEEPLRYVDDKGRVMYEGELGRMDTFSAGLFITNLLVNVLFVAACFLSFWLLARFQWLHALGHAVVLALLMM